MERNVSILPPEEFTDLHLTNPKEKAAGFPALVSSFKHIAKETGVWDGIKLLNKMNQKEGFDCPGCAWPDPDDHRSALGEYCENGVKAIAEEATKYKCDPSFFGNFSVEEISRWTDYKIGKSGRITQPFYLEKNSINYVPVSWEKAYNIIEDKIRSLEHPNQAVFYTSGRTANETAFLYQLFARQLGTNNLPDCSNMCHESSGSGLNQTLGIGKGSVKLEDLHKAEVILVIGQNPGTNHPRMLTALEKCKKNGGYIVSINPIPEAGNNAFIDPQNPWSIIKGGTVYCDSYLPVTINGDVALLKAIMLLLYELEKLQPGKVFDKPFIEKYTDGYESFINHLLQHDLDQLIEFSGVSREEIKKVADKIASSTKIIICWAMGLTQHENGVENVREVVNLLLLKGSIGKEGAGTCPVRGHSNVQGDRTMGIYEKPTESFIKRLNSVFNIKAPTDHGYDVVDAIKAMDERKVKFFMAMGGNFISATPDSLFTGKAVQNVDLTVQVSTKLNRAHLITGKEALILPCLGRSERDMLNGKIRFYSVENSMGVVHKSIGNGKPSSSQLKSEADIVSDLGALLFGSRPVKWTDFKDYDAIREGISLTIPGFESFNKKVRQSGGFYLPNGARELNFDGVGGKALFSVNKVPAKCVAEGRFIMMTIRTHDQYNTTIYGMDDRYRGIYNERRVVLMHPEDMKKMELVPKQSVHIKSYFKGEERIARNFKIVPYPIAKGCVATYFPETNVLVPINSVADVSNTPVSKFIEVSLEKF